MRWIINVINGFSRREKRSLFLILIFILLSIFYRLWNSSKDPVSIEISEIQKQEIQEFISSIEKKVEKKKEYGPTREENKITEPEYFYFDPNTLSGKELSKLGLNDFVIGNILKYRDAGGTFTDPGDLKKIYGLDEREFNRLANWIDIPEQTREKALDKDLISGEEEIYLKDTAYELNRVNFSDLMKINALTPKIAGRIINYREILGGYYDIQQLKEVYGMNDSLLSKIKPHLVIDTFALRKISLNTATFKELLRHPYLEKKQVKKIIRLKDFYGDSIRFQHLIKNRTLDDSTLDQIEPYFEN